MFDVLEDRMKNLLIQMCCKHFLIPLQKFLLYFIFVIFFILSSFVKCIYIYIYIYIYTFTKFTCIYFIFGDFLVKNGDF